LKAIHPNELDQIKLNRNARKEILQSIQSYYEWHIPDFGSMKTLPVLSAILND
jgi:DNA repair protein RecO (recombination protein O)